MFDLPIDMEEEVLSRVPVKSLGKLRLTCKKWNTITKSESFLKKKQRNGIEVVMMMDYRVSLMSVDLLSPSIDPIDKDSSRVVVWNPYLGQTRYIELPRNSIYHKCVKYALGYEKKNHKILRFVNEYLETSRDRIRELQIYSLYSNSWEVIDDFTPDWYILYKHSGVSLKGNTYWYALEEIPFHAVFGDTVTLASVREEQLAVLFHRASVVEIWITNKIEPNAVSWSNLLFAVDMKPVAGFWFPNVGRSFFVDEEKKVAVVLDKEIIDKCHLPARNIAYIIGNNGILSKVDLGESRDKFCYPLVCSYVPSSVQIPNTP
ncbi:putative F-box domain-containing protein [Arabidopsis thaliana]